MEKSTPTKKQQLKTLTTKLKDLQGKLVEAKKVEGIDEFIGVKVLKDQSRFERIVKKGEKDKAVGHFLIKIDIKAKQQDVFIPLSIASGKKPTGFLYMIEGTGEGEIASANVECRGEGVSQVTVGTILYAKIASGKTASFRIQIMIRGKMGKSYKIVINRINYKLALADTRYLQYIKEIPTDIVKFS